MQGRLDELALATGGTVGIAATQLASGRHLGMRENELFPLASLVKVPILVALYEAIRGGEIDPRERVRYAEATRVPGSGILQDLDDGLELTVRDVATLMIAISDNTAADLLLARVGKPRVEAVMD
ncbi:MAG TPA: serine hydrolase, partial [Candidatus Limnocylindria bacterium]|nr:serine hydrolase [Candidatus Limnocylindria bacterium]